MSRRRDEATREAKQSKAIAELKAENKILKRNIARLEKKLRRYEEADFDEHEEPETPTQAPAPKPGAAKKCSVCGAPLVEFKTPGRTIHGCKNCRLFGM